VREPEWQDVSEAALPPYYADVTSEAEDSSISIRFLLSLWGRTLFWGLAGFLSLLGGLSVMPANPFLGLLVLAVTLFLLASCGAACLQVIPLTLVALDQNRRGDESSHLS
jgi:hypothetical protein